MEDSAPLPNLPQAPHGLEQTVLTLGLCANSGKDWWTTTDRLAQAMAKAACAECPVQSECRQLSDAIEAIYPADGRFLAGVWAGEGPMERASRRRHAAA